MAVLETVARMSNWNGDRLDTLERRVDEGFKRMDERFDRIEERFHRLDYTLITGAIAIVVALVGRGPGEA